MQGMVGVEAQAMSDRIRREQAQTFDVTVIGGGAAGLSAAAVLGRARRSVVVIDAGAPRNATADAVHSFLTRDGLPPAELIEAARRDPLAVAQDRVSASWLPDGHQRSGRLLVHA
jgi:choline dehydrogenase-like flavoprotein